MGGKGSVYTNILRLRTMDETIVCEHGRRGLCNLANVVERADKTVFGTMLQDARFDEEGVDCLSYALQVAALENHQAMADVLIGRGADANFQGGLYETPLQAAIFGGHERMVKWLLKHGARVQTETDMLCTPLQAAALWGRPQIVTILLEHGADVDQRAGTYHTALQVASVEGNPAIVKILLEYGANVNIQGGVHGNALRAAALIVGMPVRVGSIMIGPDSGMWLDRNRGRLRNTGLTSHLQVVELLLGANQELCSQ